MATLNTSPTNNLNSFMKCANRPKPTQEKKNIFEKTEEFSQFTTIKNKNTFISQAQHNTIDESNYIFSEISSESKPKNNLNIFKTNIQHSYLTNALKRQNSTINCDNSYNTKLIMKKTINLVDESQESQKQIVSSQSQQNLKRTASKSKNRSESLERILGEKMADKLFQQIEKIQSIDVAKKGNKVHYINLFQNESSLDRSQSSVYQSQ